MIDKILKWSAHRYAKRQKLKREINKIKYGKENRPKMPTGKKLTIFLLINFSIVEFFSLYEMNKYADLSPLPTMITCVIGEVAAFSVYQIKSLKENTADKGFMYELRMKDSNENSVG